MISREGQNCCDYLSWGVFSIPLWITNLAFFWKRNLFSVLYLCGIPRSATFRCPESKLIIFSCSLVEILATTFYLLLDPELLCTTQRLWGQVSLLCALSMKINTGLWLEALKTSKQNLFHISCQKKFSLTWSQLVRRSCPNTPSMRKGGMIKGFFMEVPAITKDEDI